MTDESKIIQVECPECKGAGKVIHHYNSYRAGERIVPLYNPCESCRGTGKVNGKAQGGEMSKSVKYAEMDTAGKIHIEYDLEPNEEGEAASIRDFLAGGMVTNTKTSGGTPNVEQTIVFEIRDEFDAGKMCEILAMNGYAVKAEADNYLRLRYLVHVQAKEVK